MRTLCQPDENRICTQCKRPVPPRRAVNCPAKLAEGRPPRVVKKRPEMGDWFEGMLKKVGVTEDRYVQAKQLFHLDPFTLKAWHHPYYLQIKPPPWMHPPSQLLQLLIELHKQQWIHKVLYHL